MNRFSLKAIIGLLLFAALLSAFMTLAPAAQAAPKRVVVVFDPASPAADRRDAVMGRGCAIIRELSIVPAEVVYLPEQAAEQARESLLKHAQVTRVEDDIEVRALEAAPGAVAAARPAKPTPKPTPPPPPQTLPWGVAKIQADQAWAVSSGLLVKVGILDTGIDVDHPDLVGNIAGGTNIIRPNKLYDDDNGHGTHVAGIVAAVDNSIGVVGVAKRAKLYGVKVLNAAGSGWMSDIAAGLEWCVNNQIQVVNMSLGATADSQTLHDACIAARAAGVVMVVAAGNEGGPVCYPGAYAEVICVVATDSANHLTSWDNFGSAVDVAAPGVSVYSTYKGGGYSTLSGTSMATPHVAGVAALVLYNQPAYTPDQVQSAVTSTATNLGYDAAHQGAGLVNALNAANATK